MSVPVVSWKAFRAKRRFIAGLVSFHASALAFFFYVDFNSPNPFREITIALWAVTLCTVAYVLTISAPMLILKPKTERV